MMVAALAGAGAVLGWVTARLLAGFGYRLDEDDPRGVPGAPWWPVIALGLAWGVLAWRVGAYGRWSALPATLLFAWLAVPLTWVDLDVHRLPDGLVLPGYPALAVLLLLATLGAQGGHWRGAVAGGLGLGMLFVILAVLPGGGMGAGDVKLAGLAGLLLGWFGGAALLTGVTATFLIGGLLGGVILLRGGSRRTRFAFGPALCLGTLVGVAFGAALVG